MPDINNVINKVVPGSEEVRWSGKPENSWFQWSMLGLGGLGGSLFFVLFVLLSSWDDIGVWIIIMIGWIATSIFSIYQLRNTYYIATDKKLYVYRPFFKKIFTYSNIYAIKLEEKVSDAHRDISLFDKPYASSKNSDNYKPVVLNRIKNGAEVYDQLLGIWLEKGNYRLITNVLESISKKHHLKFTNFKESRTGNECRLSGKVEGLSFDLTLKGMQPVLALNLLMYIPNPQNYFLGIKQQTLMANVSKLFGEQDLKIGNRSFDNKFILQSDNTDFFETVLTQRNQANILNANNQSTATITFGSMDGKKIKQKSAASEKIKDNDDILDLHLIEREETPKTMISFDENIDENRITPLQIKYDLNAKFSDNPKIIAGIIKNSFASIHGLGKAIKEYNHGA